MCMRARTYTHMYMYTHTHTERYVCMGLSVCVCVCVWGICTSAASLERLSQLAQRGWILTIILGAGTMVAVLWGLWLCRSVFMRTAAMVAVFFKNCDQDPDLFLRSATMVAVLITLKIYDFLGLRSYCSKFASILKWQLRESLSAGGWGTSLSLYTHTHTEICISTDSWESLSACSDMTHYEPHNSTI